ncbi:MAG: Inward rectifier potassium channel Irk [Chitinophagaceae bacterium]|nr:Inward rectifier potassium channel Irk [Chitinophagaceae bacterium]
MALLRKINTRAKTEINTGFGTNASDYGGRFVNKDGRPNMEKRGIGLLERISWYHSMLSMPRWKFFFIIFAFYIIVNIVFACIYYLVGVQHLSGMNTDSELEKFGEAFFFSTQTFTTVGYGRISPSGFLTSAIAALEALIGLLSFALATGLLYGRFSRPKAYIRFSENALIAPFREHTALMLRLAPYKNSTLTDAEATLTVAMPVEENGRMVNKFFPLELEYNKVNALNLSWTIVHPITENSPFYRFMEEDFANTQGEIMVLFKAFDDMFSNTVVARSSYTFREVVYGAKFVPMYHRNEVANKTILELEKLNQSVPADISYSFASNHQAIS